MGPFSLRGWLLFVSVMFAVLVVGGVALTTYVIVSDGMQVVASDTTHRTAASAATLVGEASSQADRIVRNRGLQGSERVDAAEQILADRLPQLLEQTGSADAEYAIYGSGPEVLWSSSNDAILPGQIERRSEAIRTGLPTESVVERGGLLAGLLRQAQLGTTVVHTPVTLPNKIPGVLDVIYVPHVEESVIDAIRLPMGILAISAMLIMVVLMQTSMAWVLNLVDDLRRAADSIDAGRLEERLPESAQNEIGELARSINRLIGRLKRRADAQSRFVADASHELATPVAGIRGYTSLLRTWGGEDEKVREESIDAIDRESRRMARLSSDLLNLLHADQGLVLKSERLDLNVIVRERLATTASRYLDKDIEFIGPDEESLVMAGDSDRIEDVLSILLDNAGKYTPSHGQVVVTTTRQRETVVMTVSDSGEGIPENEIPRLFDRFYRSDRARAQGEAGFGLGLAIAKAIVDSMGGHIGVESVVGQGTMFTVQLPRGRV
jgi:signal transduction histidine kinase